MNKAFTKEQDTWGGACPRCGSPGKLVGDETVRAFAKAERVDDVAKPAYYCEVAACPVVYFDDFERTLTTADLRTTIWPKDAAAPICGCFRFFTAEIDADVVEGGVRRTKEAVARSKSPQAACVTGSPEGRSCAEAIQRYYFRRKADGAT